jgi:hypothetical protein
MTQPPRPTAGPWPVTAQPYAPMPAPPAPKKKGPWITSKPAIAIGALILGLILGTAGAGGGKTADAAPTVTVTGAAGATITQEVTATATVATTVTAQPPAPAGTFKDGTWLVNKDIKPGQYKSANTSGSCYWARLKNTEGGVGAILANGNPDGPGVVTIKATDVAFESARCGEWQPV